MSTITKTWTTSADFDSGTYTNANASAVADEVRRTADGFLSGDWAATYDATGPAAWKSLALHFAFAGSGQGRYRFRATDFPTQTGDPWVGFFDTTVGAVTVNLADAVIQKRRYFQIEVGVIPNIAGANSANARFLDAALTGQTATIGVASGTPVIETFGKAGAAASVCAAAEAITAEVTDAGPA